MTKFITLIKNIPNFELIRGNHSPSLYWVGEKENTN